jgi:outer membrane protein OmpA-like peptidoglycan-associated protein
MKKMSWGLYGVGIAMLLTSCVAKKKYVEAQNKITQLEQQNAECMQKSESLNTSLGTLQQTNSDLQRRYDSSYNTYTAQRSTWNNYTSFYDKQKTTAEQLHQQLHQQLDDKIGAENIKTANNKVYVTLPESTLFNAGSTTLSAKGQEIVTTLAATISQNPDVEVNVATTAVYPAMDNTAYNSDNGSMNSSTNANGNDNSTTVNSKTKSYSNNGSYSSANHSGKSTRKPVKHSYTNKSSYKNTTAKKSNGTKYKSESTRHTMRSNYASNKNYSGSSNSVAVARASTIVSALRQQGVAKAGIQVTDPVNKTSPSPRKYQVIVSPSMEGYYEMMGKNNIGTGMK